MDNDNYKSYAEYEFTNNENSHPRCKNAADSVLFTPTNDECQLINWKCVLQKCTACNFIALPGVEIDHQNDHQWLCLTFTSWNTNT